MSKEDELSKTQLAGGKVKFVCLSGLKPSDDDFEFTARCLFVPRKGEKIFYGDKRLTVLQVSYKSVETFESGVSLMVPNVLCRYEGDRTSPDIEILKAFQTRNKPNGN